MALYQMRQRDPLVDPNTQALLERRARELIGLGLIFALYTVIPQAAKFGLVFLLTGEWRTTCAPNGR